MNSFHHSIARSLYCSIALLLLSGSAQAVTINVQTYGATGNGSTDDTGAIQNAINACASGDTVVFPAGTYRVTSSMTLKSNCSYTGQNSPVLSGYTGTGAGGFPIFQTDAASSYITVSGLTMNGGGINLSGSGWTDHLTFTNNVIENIVNSNGALGPADTAIFCSGTGFQNTLISGNTFQNMFTGGNNNIIGSNFNDDSRVAIRCPHANATVIADNKFDNLNQGISIPEDHTPGTYDAFKIQRNAFTRIHRMGIEIQTWYLTNPLIEDNSFTNFLNPFFDTFGISAAWGWGPALATGAIIRRNLLVMDVPATGCCGNPTTAGYCMELAGNSGSGILIDNNVCESVGPGSWTNAIAFSPTPNHSTASNNTWCGTFPNGTYGYEAPSASGEITFTNNSTPANCNGVVSPVQGTGTPPPPPPNGAGAINLTGTASTSTNAIGLQWQISGAVTGFKIMRKATQMTAGFAQVGQVGPTVTSFTDPGLNYLWQYDYEVVATNISGDTPPSNTITVQNMIQGPVGSPCDVNGDGVTNVVDVQQEVNAALGAVTCSPTFDINKDSFCNVIDVQRVTNAALGGACVSP